MNGTERANLHVVIAGGGFSGTMLAVNLMRHDNVRATLIDRRAAFARGTAYSTAHDGHLLNVRASNMSAFPDVPDHFVRWLEARGGGGPDAFVPRSVYGAYLAELLQDAVETSGHRLRLLGGEAVDAGMDAHAVHVRMADGARVDADALVIAVGNLPPHAPAMFAGLSPDVFVADPWAGDVGEGLADEDDVLILGTGLTMIDAVLALDAHGFAGRIVATSRRGLLPRAHAAGHAAPAEPPDLSPDTLSNRLHDARARAAAAGWRPVVDAYRPHTQALWIGMIGAERRRFLRHLRPWWDVHRHRIAPGIAERISALQDEGRLSIVAGKIEAVAAAGTGVDLRWRRRGAGLAETLHARRVVNCTGPQSDLARETHPLLVRLRTRGLICPDALGLGLDVDQRCQAITAAGDTQPRLLAIGPMTRGTFWEIVAVPDIRTQCAALAARLAAKPSAVSRAAAR